MEEVREQRSRMSATVVATEVRGKKDLDGNVLM